MQTRSFVRAMALFCCVISVSAVCSAESYSQREGLFKISVPDGWHWSEQPGKVKIVNPQGDNGISIQFAPKRNPSSEEEAKALLKKGNQAMIESLVKPSNGNVVKEEERRLGGVYARQLDFLLPAKNQVGRITYISLYNKGNAFTITFGGSNEKQNSEMAKIVETLRFQ